MPMPCSTMPFALWFLLCVYRCYWLLGTACGDQGWAYWTLVGLFLWVTLSMDLNRMNMQTSVVRGGSVLWLSVQWWKYCHCGQIQNVRRTMSLCRLLPCCQTSCRLLLGGRRGIGRLSSRASLYVEPLCHGDERLLFRLCHRTIGGLLNPLPMHFCWIRFLAGRLWQRSLWWRSVVGGNGKVRS